MLSYFGRKAKIQADLLGLIRNVIKVLVSSIGLPKEVVKNKLIKMKLVIGKLPAITISKVANKIFSLIYEKRVYISYRLSNDEFDLTVAPNTEDINKQKLSDLLLYTGSNQYRTKSELISQALERILEGETLYTISRNGLLANYQWMSKGGKTHRLTDVDMEFKSPPGSAIIYDAFTDPQFRRQGLSSRGLKKIIFDCVNDGVQEIYIGHTYKNFASKALIEKEGFKVFRIFIKKRFLWFVKKQEK